MKELLIFLTGAVAGGAVVYFVFAKAIAAGKKFLSASKQALTDLKKGF